MYQNLVKAIFNAGLKVGVWIDADFERRADGGPLFFFRRSCPSSKKCCYYDFNSLTRLE